ncbi:MAG: phosphonate metabolism protein, partial [Tabrizicola sp.]
MKRYAVYYAPRAGAFAIRANEWLGREPGTDRDLPQPVLAGIGDPRGITAEPRRYGFHGTIRAPFRPADGVYEVMIRDTVADLAGRLAPVTCDGLRLEDLEG